MRQFRADLHIHSRYSRATSKKLTLPLLAAWAKVKGIDVLSTGDLTHPAWRQEMQETLELDEASGLYRLKEGLRLESVLPEFAERLQPPSPLFMLQGEISSIYKRGGKVRKVHNLVYFPTLEAVEKFCKRLEAVGNLASDGRPILGLDCRDLLAMVLEADPEAYLIPAHIWTPWFSLFGAKSGFDTVEECFGDLAGEIFAMETGLSSDPAMNWTWSALDKYSLISNSDAHSGENLGREANLFKGELSYQGIFAALKKGVVSSGSGACEFAGTLEFFPEEGKYYTDGHRKCGVVLSAKEAKELGGICPVCGGELTEGVSSRILALADRDEPLKPLGSPDFTSLVPLQEILAEIAGCGAKSQKVSRQYASIVLRYGSELSVLLDVPTSELSRFSAPLGEAIARMRAGKVIRQPGYDGEYGVISVFSPEESDELREGHRLFPLLGVGKKAVREARSTSPSSFSKDFNRGSKDFQRGNKDFPKDNRALKEQADAATSPFGAEVQPVSSLPAEEMPRPDPLMLAEVKFNSAQQAAIKAGPEPVLVLAGPGTGKTRTLVGRIESLVQSGVDPRKILAVTFTRRAALEMDKRLEHVLGKTHMPTTDTMHAIAFALWHKVLDAPVLLSEEDGKRIFADANPDLNNANLKEAWQAVALARERMEPCPAKWEAAHEAYFRHKGSWNLVDYTDLLEFWLEQIENGLFTPPWEHVLVDEIQDLSALQLTLVKRLVNTREALPAPQAKTEALPAPEDLQIGALACSESQVAGNEHAAACRQPGQGFFGIGDPNQAIYGFRGAYGRAHEYFSQLWPDLKVIGLTENYRSAQPVLVAADLVLHSALLGQANQADQTGAPDTTTLNSKMPFSVGSRKVVSALDLPAEVRLFEADSAENEAYWIADKILDLLGPTSHTLAAAKKAVAPEGLFKDRDLSPGDIAVLVRLSSLAWPLAKILEQKGLPVAVPEQEAFWSDERVKLILHAAGLFLGIASDPNEEPLACPDRVLAKGPIGVAAYLRETPPFDSLFWSSAAFNGLRKAFDAHSGWAGLINWVNLQNDLELVRLNSEKVQIMTMHASKGLEFPVVFLAGLEDGLMPFAGPELLSGQLLNQSDLKQMGKDRQAEFTDEERRLLYVAMTRAEQGLYLTCAARRRLYGRELRLPKSRFLKVLPADLLKHSRTVKHTRRKEEQLKLI